MSVIRSVAIVAFAAALSGCQTTSLMLGGTSNSSGSFPPATAPTPFTGLLNDARDANSLGPLTVDNRLTAAAQGHADDMSINDYFNHTSQNGDTLGDRLRAVGYDYCWAGENIAAGQTSQTAVFNAWMNSQGHRDNMLSSEPTEFGLGHATGGTYGNYWVLNLGRPGC